MPSRCAKLFKRGALRAIGALLLLTALAGCVRKGGEGIVMAKEHIEALEIRDSPAPETAPTATATATAGAADALVAANDDSEADAAAATQNPRATDHEQWIVSVQMVDDRRWIDVRVEKPQYDKLKEGDHVKVTYREGKYTGTVWASEIR